MARKKNRYEKNIHPYLVEAAIVSISSDYLSNEDWNLMGENVDPTNSDSLRELFHKHVYDDFHSRIEEEKRPVKTSIEFILSQDEDVPEQYYISDHIAFPFGDGKKHFVDQKLFFSVLYEVLFGHKYVTA